MKLYGIVPGAMSVLFSAIDASEYSGDAVLGTEEMFIHPSYGLLNDVNNLPEHTRIGVDYFSELCQGKEVKNVFFVDGKEMNVPEATAFYVRKLLDVSRGRNLEVAFLDDLKTFQQLARLTLEINEMGERLDNLNEGEVNLPISQEIKKLIREIYARGVEFEYTQQIKRGENLIERLEEEAKKGLGAAFITAGHTDYFISRKKELEKRGIVFDSYAREETSKDPLTFREVSALVREPAVDDDLVIGGMEKTRRKYFAVKLGRILPERNPDFIGTWDVRLPEQGLFEMYEVWRQGEAFGGSIEDINGSAEFAGRITDSIISFIKTYDKLAIRLGGADGSIAYEAELKNGKWEGTYTNPEEPGNFRFWMEPFISKN
jgi:hypothetical protein